MDSTSPDQNNNKDEYGIYSKTVDGVRDGTHLITASFIKTNDKIRDQLLKNFNYFFKLLYTNIDGLKIHPISSDKPLPILTSAKDKICPPLAPRSGIISTSRITSPSTQECATNQKKKRKKLTDGRFQFDENQQFDGPDRITGIMSISAPGNIKDAINNLLIKLKGDAHQIRYKPTQQKNSKAEKMFPGVPAGLCPKGIMRSIRHGLKKCEKTLCTAKKFTIKANMDCYDLPLPVMNGYFNQITPPKAISNSKSREHLLNKLTEFKKNGCKMLVIEYNPIDNRRMSPVWDLFINSGEIERILGIRVKIQVIPPPGERDPNSITKTWRYCKHHVNYSSKVRHIQHKTVINIDHPATLAMTDGSRPPHGISTL
jgi:hypothetical protein